MPRPAGYEIVQVNSQGPASQARGLGFVRSWKRRCFELGQESQDIRVEHDEIVAIDRGIPGCKTRREAWGTQGTDEEVGKLRSNAMNFFKGPHQGLGACPWGFVLGTHRGPQRLGCTLLPVKNKSADTGSFP